MPDSGFLMQMPEQRGSFDGEWFVEEAAGRAQLGIHVRSLLHQETSEYQDIAVYDTSFFGKLLTLDNLVMLTERDEFVYHEMLTHVPLLSIPEPREVLIIGGGDCGCAREALRHPLTRVVQCEIDERVTRACEHHFSWVAPTLADSRLELVFGDGIRFVEDQEESFDVVIIDSTDPVGAAAGLFSSEFYQQVARALKPGGVMVAQTESPHWGSRIVTEVYRQIRSVFPGVEAFLGSVPTYPSGCWSWAYAGRDRRPHDYFDLRRVAELEPGCRYYNRSLQTGAFALPTFARQAVDPSA